MKKLLTSLAIAASLATPINAQARSSSYCYERTNHFIDTMQLSKDSFQNMYNTVVESNTRQDFIVAYRAVQFGTGVALVLVDQLETLYPEFQPGGQCYSYDPTYDQKHEVESINSGLEYYTQQLEVEFERKQNYYQITDADVENSWTF